jgi:D-alanine transaminase
MPQSDTIVYLNGQFLSRRDATLDIEDRGAMYGDGVYEVLRYYGGQALAMDRHVARLRRSLAQVELAEPAEFARFGAISDELVARNGGGDAAVYWQVTRGAAPRRATFPKGVPPTVLMLTYPADPIEPSDHVQALTAVTADDVRWHNVSVKSLMLLPNVLAHNRALAAGADAAIFHRDGVVTEATSANIAIVRSGALWTHPADQWVLAGITRAIALELARDERITVHEQPFRLDALMSADEVIICGTTTHVAAIVKVDGQPIGRGEIGPVTRRLHRAFVEHVQRTCGLSAGRAAT